LRSAWGSLSTSQILVFNLISLERRLTKPHSKLELPSNAEQIQRVVSEEEPDVIVLTETWVKESEREEYARGTC
jgi:hypothetical protein